MLPSYPNIPKNKEVGLLLSLLNSGLVKNSLRLPAPKDINWDLFMQYIISHELMPFAFYKLRHKMDMVPQAVYNRLKNIYYHNISCNIIIWREFLNITDTFKANNINIVAIKGVDLLLRFYPDYCWRIMADIDVLIKEEDLSRTCKILSKMGYKKELLGLKKSYWRQKQCHICFTRSGVLLEVHWALDFKRKHRALLPCLWERVKQVSAENRTIDLLSPEDMLFGFALHNRRMGKILGLKQVFDTARIINAASNFDWDYVSREAWCGKMQATLYFLLIQAQYFTDAKIPSAFLRKLRLAYWKKKFISRLILNNTFPDSVSFPNQQNYLKAHFLLYDSLLEPILYILNIPYEQFCKYYGLKPYTPKSNYIYHMRLVFIFFKLIEYLLGAFLNLFFKKPEKGKYRF
jgi:hypothetical protein